MIFRILLTDSSGYRQLGSSLILILLTALSGCSNSDRSGASDDMAETQAQTLSEEELGRALFFDVNLSKDRTQSCATCHNPEHAFIDIRIDAEGNTPAFSLGDDGLSVGERNTPTAAYASHAPALEWGTRSRFNSQQGDYEGYIGGQFLDGRAAELATQAGGPPLNPIEMAMPDEAAVVARLQENSIYVDSMKSLYGEELFDDEAIAYEAMTKAIATFEASPFFNAFDSKYDRYLRGQYAYNPLSKAAHGKALFFSQQFTNCATCHQLLPQNFSRETFTSYEYHNIGVPANGFDRALAGKLEDFVDLGLYANIEIDADETLRGKFKVPTLRNISVTAPYMHNGVFKKLRTVIEFYDHFLEGSEHTINPETGEPWAEAEIDENISEAELQDGDLLNDEDIDALICFLDTLTDARYEHLIPERDFDCE